MAKRILYNIIFNIKTLINLKSYKVFLLIVILKYAYVQKKFF